MTLVLDRPRLIARLEAAAEFRLTTVVAGPGAGKSTLLHSWASARPVVSCTLIAADRQPNHLAHRLMVGLQPHVGQLPDELAIAVTGTDGPAPDADDPARARTLGTLLCSALDELLTRDLVLVLDDADLVDASGPAAQLIETIVRQAPALLHVVVSGQRPPPFPIDRMDQPRGVTAITEADLAFTGDETCHVLTRLAGDDAGTVAAAAQAATAGHPAAVRLLAVVLANQPVSDWADCVSTLPAARDDQLRELAVTAYEAQPLRPRELVRTVASLPAFTVPLCEHLGQAGAETTVAELVRDGLFVHAVGDRSGWFTVSQLARQWLDRRLSLDVWEAQDLHLRAAAWFETVDAFQEALQTLAAIDAAEPMAALLSRRAAALLRVVDVKTIVDAVDGLPTVGRPPHLEALVGEALQRAGEWDDALAALERAAGDAPEIPAGVAWRLGLVHYLRGELDEALGAYARARIGGDPGDEACVLAWTASVHWLRGDIATSRQLAGRAMTLAEGADDSRALALAHTALALLSANDGDRAANHAHYARALHHAERAGDLLQVVRIRGNRASLHLEEGAFEDAIAEADVAISLADVAGLASLRALALTNRGEAQFRLGRLEQATCDLEDARALYEQVGSRGVAYPLLKLADVHRERGDLALARAEYEEAIRHAEAAEDRQCLVPALAGLAEVRAGEDPAAARRLAERALAAGPGIGYTRAALAAARLALSRDDPDEAARWSRLAADDAARRRDRSGLAEALAVQAVASQPPSVELLAQAQRIWQQIGDPVGEARTASTLADLVGDGSASKAAQARLAELGSRRPTLAGRVPQAPPPLELLTLGGFRLLRDGETAPATAWQSKKARDLVKFLIARRGHRTPRDVVFDALWSEEDGGAMGNRLSVTMSTARAVLDPDKRFPPDYYVGADKEAVWLEIDHCAIDVERFLADVATGLAGRRRGEPAAAAVLARAEALYVGDVFEEDPYEDWTVSLREEARAAYMATARALAEDAAAAGEHDVAGRYLLRLLERDPYDEGAHLALVGCLTAAGQHGEARRWYRTYCARMAELDVEAAPFPGVAGSRVPTSPSPGGRARRAAG
ncbi:MAG: transcriptional regulator [Actinobacteria bacterium]|nr:transcriptional regulator [Actinomycetota bacterium]